MKRKTVRQVFSFVLSALVALGMSLQLLQADSMTGKTMPDSMVMATDMGAAGSGDCRACGKDSSSVKMMTCGSICTASVAALLPEGLPVVHSFTVDRVAAPALPLLSGRLTAPDPSPPKSFDLA